MTSQINYNDNNSEGSSIKINDKRTIPKKPLNYSQKYNNINDFKYSDNNDISLKDNNLFNNIITSFNANKVKSRNILDDNESENDSKNLSVFIKDINFNNLNEYYEIKSSIFMKKIQKLNLKFYWISEALLSEKNLEYPYNKLFLILFKEISLYIEEIERLNRLIKLKTKNESQYANKISQLTLKEKDNTMNKQVLKNLQKEYNILLKTNEKYKSNIDKLNKKLNKYSNISKLYKNNNDNFSNTTFDSLNLHNSVIMNSTKNISKNSLMNKNQNSKKPEINDIIKLGIEQCDEELYNLSKIEDLILNRFNKKNKFNSDVRSNKNKIKIKSNSKGLK